MKYLQRILAVALIVLIVAGAAIVINIKKDMNKNSLENSIEFTVNDGESGNSVIERLKEEGIIKYPQIFKIKAKENDNITKFKKGALIIEPNMSYDAIIELLVSVNRNMIKVTIPEGYELRQIAEKFAETGVVTVDEFYEAAKAENYDYKFLENIPNRENQLEGYLFPDTYNFSQESSAHDIINMMLKEFDNQFADEYYTQAEKLGMTVDEIVILASIIERETSLEEERAKVAGVFYNRIKTDMKLQSCATVQYILEDRKAKLTNKDLQIESKYNTYKYAGLPIGPIASPGIDCIKAALYPEETTAKYFVMGKDGKHVFSETYEQHLTAKKNAEN